jgi:hypothetical protein
MALGSTQPLTEMSTRNLPTGKGRPARKANNLTAICKQSVYKMWEASMSHNPMGLHGQGQLLPFLIPYPVMRETAKKKWNRVSEVRK